MNAHAPAPGFHTANPHALATILEASQTKSIIASRDIFDISGAKLWARDQPVSQSLQRKLLERQLRQPLESCLMAEDGVTVHTLVASLEEFLNRQTVLTPVLGPHAAQLIKEAQYLPLHPVVQLLLTACQASRPEAFEHSLNAMALNGVLTLSRGGSTQELRLAMLCGLLHDLGEMYIAPEHGEADADRALDFQTYQHLVVHPHVGGLLVQQLTDYPAVVARAVAEHHERLDGSGYPHCLEREKLSPQGRQLAITETVLGVMRGECPRFARASVALRVVPGEFDLAWVGPIAQASRHEGLLQTDLGSEEIQLRLALLDDSLQAAHGSIAAMSATAQSQTLKDALTLAQHLLGRLRKGWNASGLWSLDANNAQDVAEIEAAEQELLYRLGGIHSAIRLRAGKLPAEDLRSLSLLAEQLGG